METLEDANRCVKRLHQSVLDGRCITVERSRRKRPRTPTPGHYLGLKNTRDHGKSVDVFVVFGWGFSLLGLMDRGRGSIDQPCPIAAIVVTVVDPVEGAMTMTIGGLQGDLHIEAVVITLPAVRLMVEGQEGRDRILLMVAQKGTILVVRS
ncbi:hypothetical protein RHMOL_Rhmol10G0295400 [Rhododendron molle]|uniref:Uncharacterized protein n=1 Tax=Rhododendron molle TaxID=49168 RepID=A0ACC0M8L0_RHOML|nr:hypothetical protein RHMOL_Rhmol10G0295400 [Rhododendron molle]